MKMLTFYMTYLAVSLAITVWVGMTLRTNGRKFLLRTMADSDLANTVNHLLQVGFYLANVGYIALVFHTWDPLNDPAQVLVTFVEKLGSVLLILGLVHLFNMLIFARMRSSQDGANANPVKRATHTPAHVLEEAYHLRS